LVRKVQQGNGDARSQGQNRNYNPIFPLNRPDVVVPEHYLQNNTIVMWIALVAMDPPVGRAHMYLHIAVAKALI